MFLFLFSLMQESLAGTSSKATLPPIDVLNHHTSSRLPKPYWPLNLISTDQKATANFSLDQSQKINSCHYPARAFYQSLATGETQPDFDSCPELTEYLNKVPIDNVSLVYASENLISPSSMMGHVFLKLSGLRNNGDKVEHAVSFYTDLEGINIPKLFLETMLWGKDGVFALSPYSRFVDQYVGFEQRNLWEYTLQLNEVQRKFIQLHLWELKHSDLPYFFDRYNCATLIGHVLRVGRPEINFPNLNRVSPIDVVKSVERANVVESRAVVLSSEWRTRMLSKEVLSNWIPLVISNHVDLSSNSFQSDKERFLVAELGLAYTEYRLKERQISKEEGNELSQHYLELKEDIDSFSVDLSSYKSPNKLSNDTQWYFGVLDSRDQSWIRLGYLPAGLRKEDDSRQYFGNNELRLMEGSILIDPDGDKIVLDEFAFYSVSSLKPYNALTGGLSGKFEVVIEDHFDRYLNSQKSFDIEGGLGLAKELSQDISGYLMSSIGAGFSRGAGYLHGALETGVVVETAFDSKFRAGYTRLWAQMSSSDYYDLGELSFSKFINHNWTAVFQWRHLIGENNSLNELSFNLKYLY